MARIIMGAGAGYFAALFVLAIRGNYFVHLNFVLYDSIGFLSEMLAPIFVGAVMGWAWNQIASEKDNSDKSDNT